MARVIIVGGGLSGLSAAHTVLERGGRVLLLDKNPFLGGNSTKATSGINAALTKTQIEKKIPDTADIFLYDTAKSAAGHIENFVASPLARVLTHQSADGVDWLMNKFGLDLSLVSRLGGHTHPRTHRGKERFPGMTITYALMEKLEDICKADPKSAQIIVNAKVTQLINSNGTVVGCKYEKDGKTFEEYGPVVLASGGFGADFSESGLLKKYRPDLSNYSTTNGDHCSGDGIKLAADLGADLVDMEWVQVHPTGLVHPDDPNSKVKFLAAEALRGVGGLLLDVNGQRFCNELGTRDYCSAKMNENKGPFRLVLNQSGSKEIEWHCKHYAGRGLMKRFEKGADLAKDIGISADKLKEVFDKYNEAAKTGKCPFGKKFFDHAPFVMSDYFYVAIVTPVIHYCMGGVAINPEAEVIVKGGKKISGLFAAGEVAGGVHGKNRLGGNSLGECVVYGRVAGNSAAKYLLESVLSGDISISSANKRLGGITKQLAPGVHVDVDPATSRVSVNVVFDHAGGVPAVQASSSAAPAAAPAAAAPAAPAAPAKAALREIAMDEVNKHNKEKDCWVVVNGQVLDVTSFLSKHPGGKQAIMLFAGKNATDEFNMLHKPDVVDKYAPECIIGTIKQ